MDDERDASIEHRSDCEPLLELATPHIYHRNLFRVLGLPINATPKDVQRQQNRRKMQVKLGLTSSNGFGGHLALDPPPTEEDIRNAMERLHCPMDRLLDEVFWFWPTQGDASSDSALKALEQGDLKQAADVWMPLAKVAGEGHIATHNLAVLAHLIALDYEGRLATSDLTEKDRKRLADLWGRGFARWKKVFEGEDFWSVVKSRVRDLNDIQLTTGFVRRVRSMLPTALLLINAKLAYGAAERGDSNLAQRHIRLLREAGFGDGLADQAIREAIKPIRNQIKTAIDNARSRWTSKTHQGNRHVRDLYEHAKGLLAIVDAIFPEGDLTRGGLHNMVAEAMLEGQITFGSKTNDWQECIKLLELAQEFAPGDTVQSKLSENIDILQKNAESANDWCAPGYWDLPEETIAELEAIRAQTQAGNYEGAILALAIMDPKIGKPLRRCMAFSLSHRGSQMANQGLEALNRPTSKIQKFLDVIGRRGSVQAPNPEMSSFMVPDCPCCGRSSYTSWANGEYNGQRFWMCSSCSEADDREREQRKRVLRTSISESLEYLILADEIDPDDAGIRDNLKSLKEIAKQIGAQVPKTKGLKNTLGAQKTRGTHYTFEPTPEDGICFFCGESAADDSCQIRAPMCGDVQTVDLLFDKGIEYHYADAVVPRCRRCRDEHRELPSRIERWHEARLAAADNEHFPQIVAEAKSAQRVARQAVALVEEEKKKVAAAKAALAQAEAIGSRCDQCHSADSWHQHLCGRCDKRVFQLSWQVRLLIAAIMVLGLVAVYPLGSAFGAPLAVVLPIPVLVGLCVAGVFKRTQWQRRRELTEQRKADIDRRRKAAIGEAHKKTVQATSALKATAESARKPLAVYQGLRKKLEAAKQRAMSEFERLHPTPKLATGLKPEDAYLHFGRIQTLRNEGWGFGSKPEGAGNKVGNSPVKVEGLVAREPHPATERVVVACPKCGKRLRIPKRSSKSLRIKCPCGHIFDCLNGTVQEPHASGSSSSKPAKGRDRIRELAKQAGAEKMVECPICNSRMKGKSLVRHYDKFHKGAEVPDSASSKCPGCGHSWPWDGTKCKYCGHSEVQVGASEKAGRKASKSHKSASKPKSTSGTSTGSCPKCGFSYKWNGSSCGHCGYGGGGAK